MYNPLGIRGRSRERVGALQGVRRCLDCACMQLLAHRLSAGDKKKPPRGTSPTSGIVGVHWDKRAGMWHSQIRVGPMGQQRLVWSAHSDDPVALGNEYQKQKKLRRQ